MPSTARADRIRLLLDRGLAPTLLDIADDSARHAGHAGAAPGGETHYTIRVHSAAFADMSRVERHRMVNDLLVPEFESGLHAASMTLRSPDETA